MRAYLSREPIAIVAVLVALAQVLSALALHLSDEQQGSINAAVALVAGLVSALLVSLDKALPLIGGAAQAVISVGLAFGWQLDPVAQSAVMALISALTAAFLRTQVTAARGPVEV
jgi:hypothetical protein